MNKIKFKIAVKTHVHGSDANNIFIVDKNMSKKELNSLVRELVLGMVDYSCEIVNEWNE
ncbi:MAG: hypothetical protein FWC39_07365 [Bacteroidetes bacterium]|nr:hypothetical protein [Bacteroidota bacterium]